MRGKRMIFELIYSGVAGTLTLMCVRFGSDSGVRSI